MVQSDNMKIAIAIQPEAVASSVACRSVSISMMSPENL
jgi:hypothetical protein